MDNNIFWEKVDDPYYYMDGKKYISEEHVKKLIEKEKQKTKEIIDLSLKMSDILNNLVEESSKFFFSISHKRKILKIKVYEVSELLKLKIKKYDIR